MTLQEPAPRIAPDLVWRLLDESAVVVSPRSGEVRVFNPIGTTIWQLLVERTSLPDIQAHLVAHYDVTAERAHKDLQAFLEELLARGILLDANSVS